MLLETLTLFQPKISDFPQPILDLNDIKKVASAKKQTLFQTSVSESVQNLTERQTQMVKSIPNLRPKGSKTIPFGAAHTYITFIREYPPPLPLPGTLVRPSSTLVVAFLSEIKGSCLPYMFTHLYHV